MWPVRVAGLDTKPSRPLSSAFSSVEKRLAWKREDAIIIGFKRSSLRRQLAARLLPVPACQTRAQSRHPYPLLVHLRSLFGKFSVSAIDAGSMFSSSLLFVRREGYEHSLCVSRGLSYRRKCRQTLTSCVDVPTEPAMMSHPAIMSDGFAVYVYSVPSQCASSSIHTDTSLDNIVVWTAVERSSQQTARPRI